MAGLTTNGLNELITNGISTNNFAYIGVGTGSTVFTEADTGLDTELERIAVGGLTISGSTATIEAFFSNSQGNPGAGLEVAEIAIFETAAGADAVYREVLATTRAKTSAKGMLITITVDIGNA